MFRQGRGQPSFFSLMRTWGHHQWKALNPHIHLSLFRIEQPLLVFHTRVHQTGWHVKSIPFLLHCSYCTAFLPDSFQSNLVTSEAFWDHARIVCIPAPRIGPVCARSMRSALPILLHPFHSFCALLHSNILISCLVNSHIVQTMISPFLYIAPHALSAQEDRNPAVQLRVHS